MTANGPMVEDADQKGKLPLWVGLLGLLIALGATFLLGSRICPVLSALVLPPEARLPPGTIKLVEHINKGTGLDEYVYSTDKTGCEIALFYQDWLKDCVYDPDVVCGTSGPEHRFVTPNQSYHVATCTGKQSIGLFSINWTAYIATGYPTGDKTFFRVIREVAN